MNNFQKIKSFFIENKFPILIFFVLSFAISFATGFNSNHPGYFTIILGGHFCTSDLDYLTKDKIKSIAKSIGVYGVADPPIGQRLIFHK